MKKLLIIFSLVFAISFAYGQKVKETPSAIATVSSDELEKIPSGSFNEVLMSLQPTVSVGPSWSTGKDSGTVLEYKFTPRIEIVVGAYRDFNFSESFNKNFRTRAGLRLRFGGTLEKWKYEISMGQTIEGKEKINWGYIEAPAEIAYKFDAFGKRAYAGLGLSPGIKLYANWKDEDGNKGKLDDFKGFNLFISPHVGIQLCDQSELDLAYDFGVADWGGPDYKTKRINSIRFGYIHKFY